MPKAIITTGSGARVEIEGTQAEVAALLARFEAGEKSASATLPERKRPANRIKTTPMGLLSEMIAGGFFREPKELGAVRLALQEQGHFYPATTLSPIMLRLVRRKELRRIKQNKRWLYVG